MWTITLPQHPTHLHLLWGILSIDVEANDTAAEGNALNKFVWLQKCTFVFEKNPNFKQLCLFTTELHTGVVFNNTWLHAAHYFCVEVAAAVKPRNQQSHSPLRGGRSFRGEISLRARGIRCPLSLGLVVAVCPQMRSRSLKTLAQFRLKVGRFTEILGLSVT